MTNHHLSEHTRLLHIQLHSKRAARIMMYQYNHLLQNNLVEFKSISEPSAIILFILRAHIYNSIAAKNISLQVKMWFYTSHIATLSMSNTC